MFSWYTIFWRGQVVYRKFGTSSVLGIWTEGVGAQVFTFIFCALIAATFFLVDEQHSKVRLILWWKRRKKKKSLEYRTLVWELQQITFGLCESFGLEQIDALKGDIEMLKAGSGYWDIKKMLKRKSIIMVEAGRWREQLQRKKRQLNNIHPPILALPL